MADLTQTLSDYETRLWTEGAETYRELTDEGVVMAFADPAGRLVGREAVMDMLPEGGRWARAEPHDAEVTQHGDVAVISYRMRAEKQSERLEAFEANCVSVWRETADGWHQISHGQVPADALD